MHAQTWTTWVESGSWQRYREVLAPVVSARGADILRVALDRHARIHSIRKLVSQEQTLTTGVLRLANSASCAPLRPITSVTEAIVRVGTSAVRTTMLAISVASRLKRADAYGPIGRQLAEHAIGTAAAACLLAEAVGQPPEEAFVRGLLHDIGKLAILQLAHDFVAQGCPQPAPGEVEQMMRERHASMGGHLLRLWQLPDAVCDPIVNHHRPERSVRFRTETQLLYAANRLSHRHGFGCEAEPELDVLDDTVADYLPLDDRTLEQVDRRVPEAYEEARAIVI